MRFIRNLLHFDPRVARELRAQRRLIVKALIYTLGTSLLANAIIPIINLGVTAIAEKDLNRIIQLAVAVIGVYLIKYFCTRNSLYFLTEVGQRVVASLRLRLFEKLQRLPVSYFNEKRSGEIQSVLTNDVAAYANAAMIIRDSLDGPMRAAIAMVAVFLLSWQLALVAVLFVPIIAFVVNRNGRKTKAAAAELQDETARLTGMTNEALLATRVVRAFGAEKALNERYQVHVDSTFDCSMRVTKKIATMRPLVELIGAVALAVVLVVCGYLSVHAGFKVGQMAALVYALDVINQGFRAIGYANNTYQQMVASTDRMYREVFDVPEAHSHSAAARVLDRVEGRVEFQDVSFTYPDGTVALQRVSFTIEPGQSLALVGPSGAGKSTIADLLLRFYEPTSGSILLDGVPVTELDVAWLRSLTGVVPQQTFLFAGTISENIRLGKPDATDAEVEAAAHAAHVDAFIEPLPQQYESVIGEAGVGLSGGERQRLAIARAIVRMPSILLLDEATSSLDAVSEKHVQEALETIMSGRTTLFIAHRLTTAARADRILVLRQGVVVEQGSHRDLIEANGAYAGMYRAFSGGLLEEA